MLVVEDGPTLTHGEMKYGAGTVAARQFGAAELVDPRPFAVGKIKATFEKYPDIGVLLPAMGYVRPAAEGPRGDHQRLRLPTWWSSARRSTCAASSTSSIPAVQVGYDLQEIGAPTLEDVLRERKFI